MQNKNAIASQQPPRFFGAVVKLVWWPLFFFLLGALAVLGLQALSHSIGQGGPAANPPAFTKSSSGPWGELEYTTLKLERPEESLPETMADPQPIEWNFEKFSKEQVEGLIDKAGLTAEMKSALLDKSRWKAITNGWQIFPPLEVVRDMSLEARKMIYAAFRQSPLNLYVQYPIYFEADKFDEWLAESGLPPEKQELFRKMAFHEGNSVYFYDGLLMEWLCTPAEKRKVAQALSQTHTLLMKLHITPQTDMKALSRYWGHARRGNVMEPFLQALDEVPGGISVSVSHFFPTFARLRLYTFPDILNNPMAHRKNCYYTAMNFFNETPSYSFVDPEVVVATLRREYVRVTTNFIFGDVLALVDNENRIVHMCVYIADDVVFTKNGATPLAPWVLMKRTEMLKQYPMEYPLQMLAYRHKSRA